ncbi:MAG TPA: hypothetical protein VHA13_05850, partial [Gammaproteobacteria bacterium]|nr:hypothetical protein [Gammaproteobacteria bacterium]
MTVIHVKKPSTVHYLRDKIAPETLCHFLFATDPKKITAKEYYDLHFMIESHPLPRIKNFYKASLVGFNLSYKKDMLGSEGDAYTLARFLKSKKTKKPATIAEWQQCKNDKELQKNFTLDSKQLKEDYKAQFKLLLDTLHDLGIEVGILRAAGCGNYGSAFRLAYQQAVADAYKEVLTDNHYHFKYLILCEKDLETRKLFAAALDGLIILSDRNTETVAEEFIRKQFKVCLVNPGCFASLKQNYHQVKNDLNLIGIGPEQQGETILEEAFNYLNIIVSNIMHEGVINDLQKAAWEKLSVACKRDENLIKQAQLYPDLFKPYLIAVEKFLQEHSQRAIDAE